MQRAAASTTSPTTKPPPPASTATATAPYDPHDSGKPSKRRRTDDYPATPSTPGTPLQHQQSITPAPNSAAEQDDYVGQRGETQWALQLPSPGPGRGSANGHEEEDDDDDGEDEQDDSVPPGRRTYGNFKRKKNGTIVGASKADGDADDGSEDDENEDGEVDEEDEEEDVHRSAREENAMEKKSLDKLKLWKSMSSISGSGGGGVSRDKGRRDRNIGGFGEKETGVDYGKAFGKKKRKKDR